MEALVLEVAITKTYPTFILDVAFMTNALFTVLLGPSGAGKTLTLKAIAGALRPDTGRIIIDGETLLDTETETEVPPQQRRVGYVPQHYALFPHLDVRGNIGFG